MCFKTQDPFSLWAQFSHPLLHISQISKNKTLLYFIHNISRLYSSLLSTQDSLNWFPQGSLYWFPRDSFDWFQHKILSTGSNTRFPLLFFTRFPFLAPTSFLLLVPTGFVLLVLTRFPSLVPTRFPLVQGYPQRMRLQRRPKTP